jgi:5-methylcytosine-specific restriction endonuclease McrA
MSKPSISKLKKKLMEIVKQHVRERDNYTCQKTGQQVSGSNCHVSHCVPVSHGNRLAFDPMNMNVLSYHSHINWWHKNPTESGEWYKNTFPDQWEYIQRNNNVVVDWKLFNWQEMYELAKSGKWDEYQQYIQTH